MTIGDNIKIYRKKNKLTQKELGDLINKSTISIRKYEANDITPSIKVLRDIAKTLNITINKLTVDELDKIAYDKVLNMITENSLSNINDDELITYKNKIDYKEDINNQVSLYDKLEPKQLELLYLSKIKDLNTIIQSQDNMIKHLENMVESQNNMLKILGGGTDGK